MTTASETAAAPPDRLQADLIARTREGVQRMVAEIGRLAQQDIEPAEFYDGLLGRVVTSLAAVGGAIWTLQPDGAIRLARSLNFPGESLEESEPGRLRHELLLKRIAAGEDCPVVGPRSGGAGEADAGNPTEHVLVFGVIRDDERRYAILEVFQRPGGGAATQRGYARFVSQMAEIAGEYCRNRRLRSLREDEATWRRLDDFLTSIHAALDPVETAYAIANEGQRVIDCDRMSVYSVGRGGGLRLRAVSGVETPDEKSNSLKKLERLVARQLRQGGEFWRDAPDDGAANRPEENGETGTDDLAEALCDYRLASGVQAVGIVPLVRDAVSADVPSAAKRVGALAAKRMGASVGRRQDVVGALVIEQLHAEGFTGEQRRRAATVARHALLALAAAETHAGVFLMPLWRRLAWMQSLLTGSAAYKTAFVVMVLAALIMAGAVVPAEFWLSSNGELQPAVRRQVFAGIDGVVMQIHVDHGDTVSADAPLAELRNTNLEVRVAELLGRQSTVREEMQSVSNALLRETRLSDDRQTELAGRLAQLRETQINIEQQLALYRQRQAELIIRSPIKGQVIDWQVKDRLTHRPVQRGQALFTVVDPQDEWTLDLRVPQKKMGHVLRAYQRDQQAATAGKQATRVVFFLATHPGQTFEGAIRRIHQATDVSEKEGPTVLVEVAVNKEELPELRPGAAVTARIDCGRRAIGYVWLHEVIEFGQRQVLFWL